MLIPDNNIFWIMTSSGTQQCRNKLTANFS